MGWVDSGPSRLGCAGPGERCRHLIWLSGLLFQARFQSLHVLGRLSLGSCVFLLRLWVQPWGVSFSAMSVCLSWLRLVGAPSHVGAWPGGLRQSGGEVWALADHPVLPQLHHFPLLRLLGQEAHHLWTVRCRAGSVRGGGAGQGLCVWGGSPPAGPVPPCPVCARVAGVTLGPETCPWQALPSQSRRKLSAGPRPVSPPLVQGSAFTLSAESSADTVCVDGACQPVLTAGRACSQSAPARRAARAPHVLRRPVALLQGCWGL